MELGRVTLVQWWSGAPSFQRLPASLLCPQWTPALVILRLGDSSVTEGEGLISLIVPDLYQAKGRSRRLQGAHTLRRAVNSGFLLLSEGNWPLPWLMWPTEAAASPFSTFLSLPPLSWHMGAHSLLHQRAAHAAPLGGLS